MKFNLQNPILSGFLSKELDRDFSVSPPDLFPAVFLNESGPASIDFIMSPAHPLSAYISCSSPGILCTPEIDAADADAASKVYLITVAS